MRVVKEFCPYNTRRYGKPWIAKVSSWPIGKGAVLAFGHTEHLTAEIDAKPGDIVRYGQKDRRAKRHEESPWAIVQPDGSLADCTAREAREHFLANVKIDAGIIRDAEDAARAAHDLAERTVEREREYKEQQESELKKEERLQELLDSADVRHIDTCLSCCLQDPHNRPGELLLGVAVNGASTYAQVEESLLAELHSEEWNDDMPSDTATKLNEAVRAAIAKEFGRVHDKGAALFDSSLDSPPSDDPDDYAHMDDTHESDDADEIQRIRVEAMDEALHDWENAETCFAWFLITYDSDLLTEES